MNCRYPSPKYPVFVANFLFTLLAAIGLTVSTATAQAPNFGPNVTIVPAGASSATVMSALNAAGGEGQFTTGRHAVLFMPGSYTTTANGATAPAQIGFYEQIAGLGQTPSQVKITGGLAVDLLISGNLTQNFWRSQENLTEVPTGGEVNGVLDWGTSQGASLRRVNVQGGLAYVNSASEGTVNPCAEASGGFTADSQVSGLTNACSQQQWYTRNSIINVWDSNVWNFVFSGVTGAPKQSYPGTASQGDTNTTVLATTPVSREKPFLYVDSGGNFFVFSPALRTNSAGTSWSGGGLGVGTSLPISSFFIAQPSNTVAQINSALASGKNLILTPGIYKYSSPITVTTAKTVVLGMGYATLVPQAGNAAITVADVDGVQVAGLIVDAGPTNSPVLFEVGTAGSTNAAHASNPTSLNDIFFRVGGATNGLATTSLQVDSGNAILDNIWAWRADHGAVATGWTVNVGEHGLVVNGSNVTALGLAVEHYEQQQVLWNGNGGTTIFYQSELPYDVPSQSAWMDGTAHGYPSYKVASNVCTHSAYGLGIYSYFDAGVNIVEDQAMTVPNVTGINITDVGSVFLNGSGSITHVINGVGTAATSANSGTLNPVASYVGNGTCTGGTGGTGSLAAGTYMIVNQLTSQAVDNGSTNTLSAGVVQNAQNGQPQQQWAFTKNADGTWTIISKYSGQALEDPGFSTTLGKQMAQYTSNSGTNQKWNLILQSDGSFEITNASSGDALDGSSSTVNGYKLEQWTLDGQPQQRWNVIVPTSGGGTGGGGFNYTIYPGFIGIDLNNNTGGAYADSQVYVQVLAIDPKTNVFSWLKPDGTITEVSVADNNGPGHLTKNGTGYPNYSFTLAQSKLLKLPQLYSGRIFISLGEPVYTEIVATGSTLGYAGPNPQNSSDPNVNVHFDWYEFTYNTSGIFINTTQVDEFGLPLTLDVYGSNRTFHQQTGITETVAQIDQQYQSELPSIFTSTPINNLRIFSPAKTTFGAGQANGTYFDSYISQTWSYYAGNPLNVTIGSRSFSGKTSGNTFSFNEVNTGNGAFQGGTGYVIGYPNTQQVFGCYGAFAAGDPNNTDRNSVELQIEAQLCAAFNRHVTMNVSTWATPSAFYQAAPANYYAAFWHRHGINGLAYGFPYDDVASQSSTITNSDPEHMAFGIGW